jgi:hypothetical protein
VNPSGTVFVPSGQTLSIKATAQLSSGGSSNWYEFDYWSDSFSGSGSLNEISSWTGGGNAYSTWQYACPSGLTSNETATVTITANYYHDYIELSGPPSISGSSNGSTVITSAKYTLKWNVSPGSATEVQWSASAPSSNSISVTATLTYTENGNTFQDSVTVQTPLDLTCNGTGNPTIQDVWTQPKSQPVSGSSNTATTTVYIEWYCSQPIVYL